MSEPLTEIARPSLAVKAFGITDTGRVRAGHGLDGHLEHQIR